MNSYDMWRTFFGCPGCGAADDPVKRLDITLCPRCGYVYPEHGLSMAPTSAWRPTRGHQDSP